MNTVKTESQGGFPVTDWGQLAAVKGDVVNERPKALEALARRYWKPVFCYVRRSGCDEEMAKDLVQQFFLDILESDLFGKADPARGRFRNLLLKSLQYFLANTHRNAHAKKRRPLEGFVSIDEMATESGPIIVLKDTKTPDEAFHREWLRDLVLRVLSVLEQECLATGKQVHYDLFRQRVIAPILEGAESPSLHELGQLHGLSDKDVENRVITARRAYQRLLRNEIRLFASSDEEVAAEIQDLWRFMAE